LVGQFHGKTQLGSLRHSCGYSTILKLILLNSVVEQSVMRRLSIRYNSGFLCDGQLTSENPGPRDQRITLK
jgi:hypothetical protein